MGGVLLGVTGSGARVPAEVLLHARRLRRQGLASTEGAGVASLRHLGCMEITDYHAKFFAHELTRQCASDEVDKLAPVLADAKVDLNPHQVEAALFAFQPDQLTRELFASKAGESFKKFKTV